MNLRKPKWQTPFIQHRKLNSVSPVQRPIRYFPSITVTDTEKALLNYYDKNIMPKSKKNKKKKSSGWHSNNSEGSTKILKDLVKALEQKQKSPEPEPDLREDNYTQRNIVAVLGLKI